MYDRWLALGFLKHQQYLPFTKPFPRCFLWPIIHTSSGGSETLSANETAPTFVKKPFSCKNRGENKPQVHLSWFSAIFISRWSTFLLPFFLLGEDGGPPLWRMGFKWWNHGPPFVEVYGSSVRGVLTAGVNGADLKKIRQAQETHLGKAAVHTWSYQLLPP